MFLSGVGDVTVEIGEVTVVVVAVLLVVVVVGVVVVGVVLVDGIIIREVIVVVVAEVEEVTVFWRQWSFSCMHSLPRR